MCQVGAAIEIGPDLAPEYPKSSPIPTLCYVWDVASGTWIATSLRTAGPALAPKEQMQQNWILPLGYPWANPLQLGHGGTVNTIYFNACVHCFPMALEKKHTRLQP